MSYKSKRSKATDIPKKVKERVYKRDGGKCVICKKPGLPNRTFYSVEVNGGLGVEENIVTLCLDCHNDYDNGNKKDEYRNYIRNYLKSIYGDSWGEGNLIYNKWSNFKFQ